MRGGFKRSDRVAAELRREVGGLVHQATRDGLLPQISVSDVEITRDLAYATVWFTALRNADAQPAEAMLKDMAREFRMQLARRLRLRITPELRFRYDPSMEQGERIEELLRAGADAGPGTDADANAGDAPTGSAPEPGDDGVERGS